MWSLNIYISNASLYLYYEINNKLNRFLKSITSAKTNQLNVFWKQKISNVVLCCEHIKNWLSIFVISFAKSSLIFEEKIPKNMACHIISLYLYWSINKFSSKF